VSLSCFSRPYSGEPGAEARGKPKGRRRERSSYLLTRLDVYSSPNTYHQPRVPAVVVYAESTEDVQKIMRLASKYRMVRLLPLLSSCPKLMHLIDRLIPLILICSRLLLGREALRSRVISLPFVQSILLPTFSLFETSSRLWFMLYSSPMEGSPST
jgi:hypothetical protein